jgi:hypothetical protein
MVKLLTRFIWLRIGSSYGTVWQKGSGLVLGTQPLYAGPHDRASIRQRPRPFQLTYTGDESVVKQTTQLAWTRPRGFFAE